MSKILLTHPKVKEVTERQARIRAFRAEASRLASLANKRIKRIEANQLTDSPAYQRYVKDGGQRFGVKGKTYQEVQAEMGRLNRFINAETSTIRGINRELKVIADNTGIEYSNLRELQQKAKKFFELSSKVKQVLKSMDEVASALDYQKIWEAINVYTKQEGINLADADEKMDAMIDAVTKIVNERKKNDQVASQIVWFK